MPEETELSLTAQRSLLATLRRIPKTIWCLGIATFLMNTSTIIIFSFSPLFLMATFGVTALGIGVIEAVVESTSWLMRVVSGVLSDFFKKRKIFILISYSLGALARPIFPLASSATWIIVGRMIDRISNGLQATPREALIADLAPHGLKGACFGLRQALGTAGSAFGALVGVMVMKITNGNYQIVFWVATLPAILAVGLLIFMIEDARFSSERDPSRPKERKKWQSPIHWETIKSFKLSFWMVVLVTMIFLLGRFSGAFLITYAHKSGMPEHFAPTVMIVFNIFSTLSAFPLGALSDRIDRRLTLAVGFVMIILADVVLAMATSINMVFFGVVLWGIQYGITQSIPMAMVADEAPKGLRGTAFGIFYLANGIALFFANLIAGFMTKHYGHAGAFLTSGSIILFAVLGVYFISNNSKRHNA